MSKDFKFPAQFEEDVLHFLLNDLSIWVFVVKLEKPGKFLINWRIEITIVRWTKMKHNFYYCQMEISSDENLFRSWPWKRPRGSRFDSLFLKQLKFTFEDFSIWWKLFWICAVKCFVNVNIFQCDENCSDKSNYLYLRCQMFRKCSSSHNQHRTCPKLKCWNIWEVSKLMLICYFGFAKSLRNIWRVVFGLTLEKLSWQWPKTFPWWLFLWGNPSWTASPKSWCPPLWTCCSRIICSNKLRKDER